MDFFTGHGTPDLIRLNIPLVTSLPVDYQALLKITCAITTITRSSCLQQQHTDTRGDSYHFHKVRVSRCIISHLQCMHSSHHHPSTPVTRRPSPSSLLLLRRKPETNAVDTMPLIRRRRVSLPLENMPKMSTTLRTNNLRPLHSERAIRMPSHSAWDRIEVCRPTAARFELVGCAVERCFTSCAFLLA